MNLKKFVLGNSIYSFFNASLISIMLIPFIKSNNNDPLQVSTIISSRSVAWFFCMYLCGIIFDRFGAKINFLLGRLADIIAMFLLLNPTFQNLVLAMIIFGFSQGTIYGKYTSFIYNSLSASNKLNIFTKIASFYYFIFDISLSFMSFASALLLKKYDYNVLIYISIVMKIVSFVAILYFIPNYKNSNLMQFKSASIKEIFVVVVNCLKKSKQLQYLTLFYGILNFITYPLFMVIGDMLLLDKGFSRSDIGFYTMILNICSAVGTLMPVLLFKNGWKVKNCLFITFLQMLLTLMICCIYNFKTFSYSFMIIGFITCATFSIIGVSVEKKFEAFSNKKIRGSIISFAISIGNLIRIIDIMIIGFLAKYFSYKEGMVAVMMPIVLLCFYILIKLRDIKD